MAMNTIGIESGQVRILLVDDHPVVREGLRMAIATRPEFHICGSVENTVQAAEAITREKPDVMVLDLSLQGTSGLDFIKHLQISDPGLPILVLSAMDETDYAERAIRAGAKGYIMKQEPLEKLIKAMVAVSEGRVYLSDAIRSSLVQRMVKNSSTDSASPVAELSDRELEVFSEVGSGLGTRQIAEKLHLSVKTVEAHFANIKRKMKLEGSSALLRSAIRWLDAKNPI